MTWDCVMCLLRLLETRDIRLVHEQEAPILLFLLSIWFLVGNMPASLATYRYSK